MQTTPFLSLKNLTIMKKKDKITALILKFMTEFNQDTLRTLEKLCRITLDPDEESSLLKNLDKILQYVDQLKKIDTKNVIPLSHPIESMAAPLREDSLGYMMDTEEFLKNSPSHLGSMIKVPDVITEEET